MRPKLNLKDKGQMTKPNKYTDTFKSNLTCNFFLSIKLKKKHFALGHGVHKVCGRFFQILWPSQNIQTLLPQ